MIELRWITIGDQKFLQYRSIIPTWQVTGAWGEPSAWGKWRDVETIENDNHPPDEICV